MAYRMVDSEIQHDEEGGHCSNLSAKKWQNLAPSASRDSAPLIFLGRDVVSWSETAVKDKKWACVLRFIKHLSSSCLFYFATYHDAYWLKHELWSDTIFIYHGNDNEGDRPTDNIIYYFYSTHIMGAFDFTRFEFGPSEFARIRHACSLLTCQRSLFTEAALGHGGSNEPPKRKAG